MMEPLGGGRIRKSCDDIADSTVTDYNNDVKNALQEHREYENLC